jgi:hypothetical protein
MDNINTDIVKKIALSLNAYAKTELLYISASLYKRFLFFRH